MVSLPKKLPGLGVRKICGSSLFFILVVAVVTYRQYIPITTVLLQKTTIKKHPAIAPAVLQVSHDEASVRKDYDVILSTPCLMMLAGNQSYKRYAVFSVNWDGDSFSYSFMLPLTTLAWRRIGYGSVVLIVGNLQQWRNTPARKHILDSTLEQGAIVVFLQGAPPVNSVMLSQVGRLFAAAFVPFNGSSNAVLVTSDADIWPVKAATYTLPSGRTSIVSINAFCCGNFRHNRTAYRLLPMTNFVANVVTWRKLIRRHTALPLCAGDILTYAESLFGAIARKAVRKGGNVGWNMDQYMVSMWVDEWQRHFGNDSVAYVRRECSHDRIDRNSWAPRTLHGAIDAHLLVGLHEERNWKRVRPLLNLLYGNTSPEYRWCERYQSHFLTLISKKPYLTTKITDGVPLFKKP